MIDLIPSHVRKSNGQVKTRQTQIQNTKKDTSATEGEKGMVCRKNSPSINNKNARGIGRSLDFVCLSSSSSSSAINEVQFDIFFDSLGIAFCFIYDFSRFFFFWSKVPGNMRNLVWKASDWLKWALIYRDELSAGALHSNKVVLVCFHKWLYVKSCWVIGVFLGEAWGISWAISLDSTDLVTGLVIRIGFRWILWVDISILI